MIQTSDIRRLTEPLVHYSVITATTVTIQVVMVTTLTLTQTQVKVINRRTLVRFLGINVINLGQNLTVSKISYDRVII